MKFFCIIHQCRNIWLQIEGNKLVLLLHILHWTMHHSKGQCVYFSLLNLIAQHHFLIGVYMWIAYQGIKEIIKSNKEVCNAVNFTVFCYVIVLLLAVLLWYQWKGSCLSRVLKDVKLQGQQPCSVSLKLSTIHQECLYWRYVPLDTALTLLQYMIHVEHRDLRHKILGRVLH